MKWNPMGTEFPIEKVKAAYKKARSYDHVRLGKEMIFVRRFLTVFYLPYEEIEKVHLYAGEAVASDYYTWQLVVRPKNGEERRFTVETEDHAMQLLDGLKKAYPSVPLGK